MQKTQKIKNSTIIFVGIILILVGVFVVLFQYFLAKKDKAFSDMNILLLESEIPKIIDENNDNPTDVNPGGTPTGEPNKEEQKKDTIKYDYDGILEIPKINLKRGFPNINSWYNNVDRNITVINGSTMPNEENNNLILAAHSGYCYYCYFDDLYKLSNGDIAIVYYKGYKYTYKVVNIYEVEKTGTVAIYRDKNKNVLTLITCTRNDKTKQTVYILELDNKEIN